MQIAIDMMGGDYAPEQACKGLISFLKEFDDCMLHLVGDKELIEFHLGEFSTHHCIKYIPTSQTIEMNEHPIKAMKEKQDSSLVVGFRLLAQGVADIFISAGNTGVMLIGATQIIKSIEGVLRPSIPTPVPQIDGSFSIMLDVGINADCKPDHLNQFGILGSVFAHYIYNIEQPRVALLNIGEEEGKGNLLSQAAYQLLKENKQIHFIGNIEGRDLLENKADVIITDGFTGNIVLKFAESLYDTIRTKRNIQDEFLDRFNHKIYAAVPVLGINKPVLVAHGVSDEASFLGMFKMARKMLETKMNDRLIASFALP
ncbi:MAG: phosphate:acyl-(acyl carrier protein) acyltransferase [Bacteroidetes bacterium OLB11]|nr:MAG: phosphate:acyl-(acyl carrier protein) acyltransferase [Bacteroidetes bacterium OLB11]